MRCVVDYAAERTSKQEAAVVVCRAGVAGPASDEGGQGAVHHAAASPGPGQPVAWTKVNARDASLRTAAAPDSPSDSTLLVDVPRC